MQPGYKTPFNINAKKLYWIFAQYPSYYEILRERNRAYSFDVAEVWQQDKNGNEALRKIMWISCHVLERYRNNLHHLYKSPVHDSLYSVRIVIRERNRAYSFDVAEVWQQDKNGNEAVVSEES